MAAILKAIGLLLAPILRELASVLLDHFTGPEVKSVKDADPVLNRVEKDPTVDSLEKRLRKTMGALAVAGVLLLPGCASKVDILYARASKRPEETNGFLRMAQDEARVNVVGTDTAAEMSGLAGYLLLHEQDVAALVRAAKGEEQ